MPSAPIIPLNNVVIALCATLPVLILLYRWQLGTKQSIYAIFRMLVQLLLVGYILAYIFQVNNLLLICLILCAMIIISSWIALGTTTQHRAALLLPTFISIATGGGLTLILITQVVLELEPWYSAQYMIPLAGMIFANAMNSISLAAERVDSELGHNSNFIDARATALKAALIPVINSLLAVGIVSLPGMMTGQILSGVSPLIAARYQIVVMCMIFSSAGLSSACFLILSKAHYLKVSKAN